MTTPDGHPPAGAPEPDDTAGGWQPAALPTRSTDPVPVVLVGSAAWLAALAALGVLALTGARPADAWLWACAVGVALGGIGLGVLALQRRSAARGSRSAQVVR